MLSQETSTQNSEQHTQLELHFDIWTYLVSLLPRFSKKEKKWSWSRTGVCEGWLRIITVPGIQWAPCKHLFNTPEEWQEWQSYTEWPWVKANGFKRQPGEQPDTFSPVVFAAQDMLAEACWPWRAASSWHTGQWLRHKVAVKEHADGTWYSFL